MRFARSDMRDHIVSRKNDHGASYRRYGVLPKRSWLKTNICEIFDVVQLSTFATLSPDEPTSLARLITSEKPSLRPTSAVTFDDKQSRNRRGRSASSIRA